MGCCVFKAACVIAIHSLISKTQRITSILGIVKTHGFLFVITNYDVIEKLFKQIKPLSIDLFCRSNKKGALKAPLFHRLLIRTFVQGFLLPLIKSICPFLHHFAARLNILGMIISASYFISIGMG